jgi:ABC-type lipoprotein export system ATPase subunit
MITIKNLTKHYDNGLIKALNGVSLAIAEGEAVSIMGPSGCGKTTLLSIIGTLDAPTEGEVWIDGNNIHAERSFDKFRAHSLGFVFQFHHLIPNLSLLENVEIPMYALGIPGRQRREKASQILEEMGLKERLKSLPSRVSGGERQRAAVARAMANNPKIILADEPTGSLDTVTGDRIIELLLALCTERRLTLVMATHNPEVAAKTGRTIWMRNGVTISTGNG